jgi:hypothetical protein
MKKIEMVSGWDGLKAEVKNEQTRYSIEVTVFENPDGGYDIGSLDGIITVETAAEAVAEMRKWQPDLRRWRKVEAPE